jgi:hypothetical protein
VLKSVNFPGPLLLAFLAVHDILSTPRDTGLVISIAAEKSKLNHQQNIHDLYSHAIKSDNSPMSDAVLTVKHKCE